MSNSVDDSLYSLELSVPENGLEYMYGSGVLNKDVTLSSPAIELRVNQIEEMPDELPGETPDGIPQEKPDDLPDGTAGNTTGSAGQNSSLNDTKPAGQNTTNSSSEKKALETGDHTLLDFYVVLLGIEIAGIVAVVLRRYRKFK